MTAERIEQIQTGREVIPVELVGTDAVLREGRYNDGYLSRINAMYSLVFEILGARKTEIRRGSWSGFDHFTMNSPLQNSEGEQVLNAILYASARADVWQPEIIEVPKLTDTTIRTARKYLKAVEEAYKVPGMVNQGTLYGIHIARDGGFVNLTNVGENVIVVPNQTFVEYCLQRKRK